ncbi:MAG: helix-turn-helix transcriptional regulator, partial [Clostridia bacterium]|nr:helix-turn-helix transcriptional regulator [Clostridia bacterium]
MFDVGKRIRYFREQRGLTVNGLANMAGISQSYLREIEL